MKLSIIVAMFNAELYIKRCLESIYNKNSLDYDDFEVIVIDDGSTDKSSEIVLSLQVKFSNIILLKKDNGGQSSARNMGFKRATGKYILCLDSDDYIEGDKLDYLLNRVLLNNNDIIAFDCRVVDYQSNLISEQLFNYKVKESENISIDEFCKKTIILGAMCFYFYKRSVILENNLYLHEGIKLEDEEFVTLFFSYSKTISYYKEILYNYRKHEASTTNISDREHKVRLMFNLLEVLKVLKKRSNELNGNGNDDLSKDIVDYKIQQLTSSLIINLFKNKVNKNDRMSIINGLYEYKLFPIIISKISSFKHKLFSYFLNFNRWLTLLF
ncbi:glycosyltransferase family 2 protein [Myroides marinus]|uniref:glycosyltransferase family 2 protein n=1 Tax=Myroides marinus TaxID=703342 RepID=UPI0025749822|nr:glycosyltransferase family A protein [Myroides marinus]MDM1503176.1 glycosyltransferase family 2 protein [Myroides marinus]